MDDQTILYPTLEMFFEGLGVYAFHLPTARFRTWRDPKGSRMGVTDGSVAHLFAMDAFRAHYTLASINDPRFGVALQDYTTALKETLGNAFRSSRG
jgi:hypothetical protein